MAYKQKLPFIAIYVLGSSISMLIFVTVIHTHKTDGSRITKGVCRGAVSGDVGRG